MTAFLESTTDPKNEHTVVRPLADRLTVSVVIPCFNEQRFIASVLENLANQYDSDRYEIIVVDGQSTDDTRKVISGFAAANPGVHVSVVDNPARNIPVALNLGIKAAGGEFIVRMDAHSVPSFNYVSRCVELLKDEEASVVGMSWHIKPGDASTVARAIALAVAHPFGVGDARYRLATTAARLVDTVPFGAFRKSLWETVGGFNEDLLTNEDYDFNYRVRKKGGRILLETGAHTDYFARSTLRALAAQYLRYGMWKAQMVKLHPRSIKARQLVAPLFLLYLILSIVLTVAIPNGTLLLLPLLLYLMLSFLFSLKLAHPAGDWKLVVVIPLVFLVIHCSWGAGFLFGLSQTLRR